MNEYVEQQIDKNVVFSESKSVLLKTVNKISNVILASNINTAEYQAHNLLKQKKKTKLLPVIIQVFDISQLLNA